MDRRFKKISASVLYFVSVLTLFMMLFHSVDLISLSHGMKIFTGIVTVLSGYIAAYIIADGCENILSSKRIIRRQLIFTFIFYLIMLVDFTLIDDSLGRDIFNVFSWDKEAFKEYINTSTNLIPFKTVRLFINGYKNGHLPLFSMLENILGNLLAFVPLPFFVTCLYKNKNGKYFVFLSILLSVLSVEVLQFLFLTGSADIDDVILNVGGAMLVSLFFKINSFNNIIERITFGVWEAYEKYEPQAKGKC